MNIPPFIPKWKAPSLLITPDEAQLVWHVLRQYMNHRSPSKPQAKHHELNPMALTLIARLDTYLQLSKFQKDFEILPMQQHLELDMDESLLVCRSLFEYASVERHELSQNTIYLIQKLQTHLSSQRHN